MEDIERIKERLDNIHSIQPIITSLRTIAAGSWSSGLRRLQGCREFSANLLDVIADVWPLVDTEWAMAQGFVRETLPLRNVLVLVVASEQGLCGAYNDTVLTGADELLGQLRIKANQVQVATLGARALDHFRRSNIEPVRAYTAPITRLPSLDLVGEISDDLQGMLASGQFDAIEVVYAPYVPGQLAPPTMTRWLPVSAALLPSRQEQWPPPIIETNPSVLFQRSARQYRDVRLFELITESACSEHAARYRSMDAASTNLKNLIEELTQGYHAARQHAITMEMLDLVAGAGILRGSRERGKR